jgi:exodeoxyribonuclease X
MITKVRCMDTETCSLKPDQVPGGGVVEIGHCDLTLMDGFWVVGQPHSELIDPKILIPPTASAIHHLTNEDVSGARTFAEVATDVLAFAGEHGIPLCSHYARFDRQWWQPIQLCTWRLAVWFMPEAPDHGLQALRYFGKLDKNPGFERWNAWPPHRAKADAYLCAQLLGRFLNHGMTVEEAMKISAHPALLPRFTFGQHAGKPIEEVPTSYLTWIVSPRGISDNEDVTYTARRYLEARQNASFKAAGGDQPTSAK